MRNLEFFHKMLYTELASQFEEDREETVMEILDTSGVGNTLSKFLISVRQEVSKDEFDVISSERFLQVFALYSACSDLEYGDKVDINRLISGK